MRIEVAIEAIGAPLISDVIALASRVCAVGLAGRQRRGADENREHGRSEDCPAHQRSNQMDSMASARPQMIQMISTPITTS